MSTPNPNCKRCMAIYSLCLICSADKIAAMRIKENKENYELSQKIKS